MAKLFVQTLADLRYGETHRELTAAMQELVAAVNHTNKAGELTFKVRIKPGSGGSLEITDQISVKKPELPRGSSIFFATAENDLVRNDPRQATLPGLRNIDVSTGEIREVANGK